MSLSGASVAGTEITPGKEPELAPGVRGILFDYPEAVWIPMIRAESQGQGDVGKYIDSLPTDRAVIFPCVISHVLEGMLRRRGFTPTLLTDVKPEVYASVKELDLDQDPGLKVWIRESH